ncbi:transporter [Vibrio sp. UCD-FRSSP16_10]|uniref:lipoprotein-releasing ABC transporter permease subunit LolC n=1 Tax=unclassified Vibrio TaxID=2614977 RepID=UPI0007FF948A|nr:MULTISPECIES: lipoprotein-releasing ABC transporter permease subunit LolC [unclassified Vibrio]OBT13969.1 transporter [Vibrio sp. UCD-FRSSP16_30]OBT22850.1 transporter [Vibrio sp. UCD-FRSSP16_10]
MFRPIPLYIGLRYLRGRSGDRFSRFVSYMSTAGITIGVLSLITVLSVMNGFEGQLKGRILGVLPQAIVGDVSGKTVRTELPPQFITALPHVVDTAPIVSSEAVLQSPAHLAAGQLIGIDGNLNEPLRKFMLSGSVDSLEKGKYHILIGHTLARTLKVSQGDKVRLMVTSTSQYSPIGRIPSQRNFTVSGIFNTGSDVDGQLMVANIEDAGRLLKMNSSQISGWRLYLDDPFAVSRLAQLPLSEGWTWQDWRAQRGELFQAVRMEKNMMGLMLGLIVGVAAFNIISALIMVVMEKQSEVAILKTQGMTKQQVMAIFVVQGASSGVVGAVFGGLLGILLASNLNSILQVLGVSLYAYGGKLPILIDYGQVLVVVSLAVCLSVFATLYPSYRAASVKPAEALRYE